MTNAKVEFDDCYRCGGSPDVDEDGAFYTCFVCCNTGLLPKAEVDAHYQAEVDYAEAFRPKHLGIFVKKATVYTDSSGESYGDEYAGYDEMEQLVCTACNGEGRTQPDLQGMTRDCEPCRGDGATWHQIQRAPGHRLFTGLFIAPRSFLTTVACFACDDDIPF
jgi:hypothetical protein